MGAARTLAVLLGRRGVRAEYVLLMLAAYLTPIVLWLGFAMHPAVLLPLVTLPLAVPLIRTVLTVLGPPLNRTLAGTAQLAVIFAVALAVGLVG